MRTETSIDQSRRLAAEMSHLLVIFDKKLGHDELPVRERPLRALFMLFEYETIEMEFEGCRVTGENIAEYVATDWFRVLYAAVEHWYVDQFGPEAVADTGNMPLEGAILIRGTPFALRAPANRHKVAIEGEQAWIYFEEGLGENEVAHQWIVGGPDLDKLDANTRTEIEAQAAFIASTLRYVEFRRVTTPSDGNEQARQLVATTLASLEQAARRMVGGREAERGPSWYDLQMACECSLKAVLQLNTGSQPITHRLDDLLREASAYGVVFDAVRLDKLPNPKQVAEWRYGQGSPWRLEFQYPAYLTTLDLVRSAMSQVPTGLASGLGILIRYPRWRSDSGRAELF